MNNSFKPSKAPIFKRVTRQPQPLTLPEKRRALLVQHLRRMVEADPQTARRALQMSQEHLPEMHLISLYEPSKNWVEAVMNNDSMHSLMVQERTP